MQLTPLLVSIGLKEDGPRRPKDKGQAVHAFPDFSSLPIVQASGMDWSNYVDVRGLGWHYDQCCGHALDTPDSPAGTWNGLLLVPANFADEAAAAFPACTKLSDAEARAFWEDHATSQMSDEEVDNEVLQGIELKQRLNLPLTPAQQLAIDPNDDTPGIRKNKTKLWNDYKALTGTQIVQ